MSEENALVLKFRQGLLERGASGIKNFARFFLTQERQDKSSPSLDLDEFSQGVHAYNLSFSQAEIKEIFRKFDSDGSGKIDFTEFLEHVRVS
jgi:Ca2+-binding EF-hand superfamily protein